jgi:hypothetical protein
MPLEFIRLRTSSLLVVTLGCMLKWLVSGKIVMRLASFMRYSMLGVLFCRAKKKLTHPG